MKERTIHPEFRLNGVSCNAATLQEYAYCFIKEGAPYEKHIGDFLLDWLSTSLTITVQTSGSTGTPKQLVIKKEHMVNSALATGMFFELEQGNTVLYCLSTEFIAGKMMLVRALILGLDIICVAPVSNPLEATNAKFDFAAMVPLQLINSIDKIHHIKTLLVGGAPFLDDLKELVQNKPTNIYETYGMTETITHIALKRINHLKNVETDQESNAFKVLPEVSITMDNRDCLVISAPNISDAEVVTNDVVRMISETEFEWLGRYDNVINSGGIKLFPERIEAKLTKMVAHRFFVAGLPDEKLGQKLVLFVEGKSDIGNSLETISGATFLDKFEIPKDVIFVPNFKETKNGKINRRTTLQSVIG
ncbi:AMP-binding protein [Maribacter antarcticus]|uniref:AMP-binding protein n=1 Tax=Maribacter antarcticus TaxID=505250 RepID=UPI00047E86AC|nr:AMP-binding protein [Maribacter antarcticus]